MSATLGLLIALAVSGNSFTPPNEKLIKESAVRALTLLEASTREYPKHRDCFSCHHQGVPVLALTLAQRRGLNVDLENLNAITEHTKEDLEKSIGDYRQGKGQPGGVTRAGYALWSLARAGAKPDATTDAVAAFLLNRDARSDHWEPSGRRPPSEASAFTTTYLALASLDKYGGHLPADRRAERVKKARVWLESNSGKETEDRVFRLLALHSAGSDRTQVEKAARDLVGRQHADGGWSQLDEGESDAYATGSVLTALRLVDAVAADAVAYQTGLNYLIKTQAADGSWYVKSRSTPFQPYFESGFPHKKDQFIAIAASAWATSALLLAIKELPPSPTLPLGQPPASLGLDPFYAKYVDAGGIPVVGSAQVSDRALLEAAYLVKKLLEGRMDLQEALVARKLRLAVMSYAERTTDLPEQKGMKPKEFWDVRARGLGASRDKPLVSCGEENLLNLRGDPYAGENILIHEFAHALHSLAIIDLDAGFQRRLNEAHGNAVLEGRWKGTYAASSPAEYWAEAVQSWFDCNLQPPDFQHNEINTREKLKSYDPALARLVAEVFGDRPWRYQPPGRRPADDSPHLAGFDPTKAARFSWGNQQKKYDEVVAEKKKLRAAESVRGTTP